MESSRTPTNLAPDVCGDHSPSENCNGSSCRNTASTPRTDHSRDSPAKCRPNLETASRPRVVLTGEIYSPSGESLSPAAMFLSPRRSVKPPMPPRRVQGLHERRRSCSTQRQPPYPIVALSCYFQSPPRAGKRIPRIPVPRQTKRCLSPLPSRVLPDRSAAKTSWKIKELELLNYQLKKQFVVARGERKKALGARDLGPVWMSDFTPSLNRQRKDRRRCSTTT